MIKARIGWACRRGMLELDLILGPFFEQQFSDLSPKDQAIFERLLTVEDPMLYQWFLGSEQPEEFDFLQMIQRIRAHAITVQT